MISTTQKDLFSKKVYYEFRSSPHLKNKYPVNKFLSVDYSKLRLYNSQKISNVYFVGRGSPYKDCGTFEKAYTCPCKKTYKVIHKTCYQLSCPVCYQKGIERASRRVSKRFKRILRAFKTQGINLKIHHYTFSPLLEVNNLADLLNAKNSILKILKKYNFSGILVMHPYVVKNDKYLRKRLHFHVLGVGYLPSDFYQKEGFVAKKLSSKPYKKRKRFYYKFQYLLSHTVAIPHMHSFVWFNQFAYNRLAKTNLKKSVDNIRCSSCDRPLYRVKNNFIKTEGNFHTGINYFFDYEKPFEFDYFDALFSKKEDWDLIYRGDPDKFQKDLYKYYNKEKIS